MSNKSPLGFFTRKFNNTSLQDTTQGSIIYPETSPSITGYTFMYIKKLPPIPLVEKHTNIILGALSRGYTLPQVTLSENMFDLFQPLPLPGKLNSGTDLSVKFIDTQDMHATTTFKYWFQAIRPMDSSFKSLHQSMVKKIKPGLYVEQYSTDIVIFSTDPTLNSVLQAVLLKGAWPSSFPMDILNVEISNVEAYTFVQNFKVKQLVSLEDVFIEYLNGEILPMLQDHFDTLN